MKSDGGLYDTPIVTFNTERRNKLHDRYYGKQPPLEFLMIILYSIAKSECGCYKLV